MTESGYSSKQIALHWIIAILIVIQFVLHDGIEEVWLQVRDGGEVTRSVLAFSHVAIGILIFVLALWRITLRLTRGAPPPPEDEAPALQMLAGLTHLVLYALLLLMPISGMTMWFGGVEAAGFGHFVGKTLMLAFVALHVIGALYHRFVLKSDVMQRMTRPQ